MAILVHVSIPDSSVGYGKLRPGLMAKLSSPIYILPEAITYLPTYFFFVFLGPHPRHKEVPRLGVKSELQLPVYTTTTAMQDPNHIFDLHHSSWQHQILNPLSEVKDQTHILMDTSWVLNPLSHNGNSIFFLFQFFYFLAAPAACESSQTRDRTGANTAMTMPDP